MMPFYIRTAVINFQLLLWCVHFSGIGHIVISDTVLALSFDFICILNIVLDDEDVVEHCILWDNNDVVG